jgi:hypothetical protein
MTQYLTWASYGGDARIWLALGLLAAACCVALAGIRLPLPVRFTRPGPAGRAATIAAWATSAAALLVCATIYAGQVGRDVRAAGLPAATLKLTILPVTLTAAAVLFVIILSRRSPDLPTRLASAAIGAMAAPVIFELSFDPIVIFRIHSVLPDPPPLALGYVPALMAEIATLLLLRLSPMVRLTRATFFSFALMLGVWAAWAALAGFGYPSAPLPIALNIASKILAFVAAFTLFLPRQPAPGQVPQPANNEHLRRWPRRTGRDVTTGVAAVSQLPPGRSGQPHGNSPAARSNNAWKHVLPAGRRGAQYCWAVSLDVGSEGWSWACTGPWWWARMGRIPPFAPWTGPPRWRVSRPRSW